MRKILLNSKKIITVLVLTAIMMCTVVPVVQAAVPTFSYRGFTMTKNGKRVGSDNMYSRTDVTAYSSSNGVPGNAVAGASMRENSGYIYLISSGKASVTSDKHATSTTAWHAYGIGTKDDAMKASNRWLQNKWTD